MTIPPVPTPHLIVVEPDLTFGGFEAFLNRPPSANHADHLLQRGVGRARSDIISYLGGSTEAAPGEQPPLGHPSGGAQREPCPVVPPLAFTAGSTTHPPPCAALKPPDDRGGPLACVPSQYPVWRAHPQHLGELLLLQPRSHPPVIAVD
jgi:hypothetical protein